MKTLIDREHFKARLVQCIKELETEPLYTEEQRQTVKVVYESVLYKLSEEPTVEYIYGVDCK